MIAGELREGFRHARPDLYGMLGDGVRESVDGLVQRRCQRLDCELLKGLYQRMSEAMQSVAEATNAVALDIVQNLTHLLRGEFLMIEERDEVGDGPLKIDVVFPQSIVSIDEESLWRHRHPVHNTSLCDILRFRNSGLQSALNLSSMQALRALRLSPEPVYL